MKEGRAVCEHQDTTQNRSIRETTSASVPLLNHDEVEHQAQLPSPHHHVHPSAIPPPAVPRLGLAVSSSPHRPPPRRPPPIAAP